MKLAFETAMAAGITSFVVTVDSQALIDYYQADEGAASPVAELAQAAADTGAGLLLGVNFLTPVYGQLKEQIGEAVGAHGQVLSAPPPLSDLYWDMALRPLFLGAARAAAANPGILGVHMDMELYGAGSLWYAQGFAFDEDTWAKIGASLEEVAPDLATQAAALPLGDRLPWLVDHGLAGHALEHLEELTALRAAALREDLWELHPQMELAFYGVQVSTAWFYRGWMRGFGTPSRPVTHLSYDIVTNRARRVFQRENIHVRILGGFLGVRFKPEDFRVGLANAGARADGYWLFQFTDFPAAWDPDDPPLLHGTPDEYWNAVGEANALLDQAPIP